MSGFNWNDIASSGNLHVQKNELHALRIVQRMPVGGGSDADVPICTGSDVPLLLLALAKTYGVSLALSADFTVTAVGFKTP